jgi:thiosulfate dehydrogenase [quinone] large subunit
MKKHTALLLLRLGIGWYFLYAGITKLIDPTWTADGYIKGAQGCLKPLYVFFGSTNVLPFINILNEWGLTLIGVALILGVATRFSAVCGILLMALYYLALPFPHPDAHALIVDDHIVFITIFLTLIAFKNDDRLSFLPALRNSLPKFLQ